jgi:hypothetical protein
LISFRYHLISIVAVFVALVLGIVAGSTVVRGPLVDSLRANVNAAARNLQAVSDENKRLSGDLGRYQEIDRALASGDVAELTDGLLEDVDVVLVASGGVDSGDLRTLRDSLRKAGGRIVEDVRLDESLTLADADAVANLAQTLHEPVADAATLRSKVVELLATAFTPIAVSGEAAAATTTVPSSTTTTTRAPAVTTTTIPITRALVDLRTAIDDLAAGGFVKVEDRVEAAPRPYVRLVIVGASGATPTGDALCYPLLDRLARVPAFTVAVETRPVKSDVGRGDFIRGLRNDERLRDTVSTVDDGDIWAGRMAAVLAVHALSEGTVGRYGVGEGADAVLPPFTP